MNQKDTTTLEPSVEPKLLLSYLLAQCDETSHHHLTLGFTFQFLGYAALHFDKKLLREYRNIDLPRYTPVDRLQAYKRIFTTAIKQTIPQDIPCPPMPEYSRSEEPDICNRFMLTALRDGRTMLNDNHYEFLPVFLLISWLSLRFDKRALSDFENRCVGSDIEPREKIETALAILRQASANAERDLSNLN